MTYHSRLVVLRRRLQPACDLGWLALLAVLPFAFASPSPAQVCTPSVSGAVSETLGGIRVGDNAVGSYGLDGAECSLDFGFLTAGFSNGDGTVLLENSASLTLLNSLQVSQTGLGLVTVASGSSITANDCRISYRDGDGGANASGTGTLVVTGANSLVTCNDELQVGTDGIGTLELSSGAQMTALRTGLTGFESNALGEIRVLSGASLDINGSNGATHIIGVRGSGRVEIDGGSLTFSSAASGYLTTCTVGGCDVEMSVANGGLLLAQNLIARNNTTLMLDGGTIELEQDLLQLNGASVLTGFGTIVGDLDNRGDVLPGLDGIGQIDIVSDDAFDGNFFNLSGSSVEFEIASDESFDRIVVDGDLLFDGNLDVVFVDAFVPAANSSFEILTVGGDITWTPNSIDILGLPAEVLAETMVVEEIGAIVVTVPEPSSTLLALVALATSLVLARRRPQPSAY